VNASGRRGPLNGGLLLVFLIIMISSSRQCNGPATSTSSYNEPAPVPVRNPIGEALRPDPAAEYRDGIAAAILIDTSGSMRDRVKDTDGSSRPKIEIAQRAALNLVRQFDSYAREHSDQSIVVGIYEFSDRGRNTPLCREIIKLAPPNPASAEAAIKQMRAAGDTPIGVSKDMCPVCQSFFRAEAARLGRTLVVADPSAVRLFRPNGSVEMR